MRKQTGSHYGWLEQGRDGILAGLEDGVTPGTG